MAPVVITASSYTSRDFRRARSRYLLDKPFLYLSCIISTSQFSARVVGLVLLESNTYLQIYRILAADDPIQVGRGRGGSIF
jgi:hypothetical protein